MTTLFQKALKQEQTERPPLWIMRQAGRYLPEYLETRKEAGSFLDLCYNSDLACEVTMQPIRRFNLDAAIMFSDILVIPHALGYDVQFVAGEGPVVEKLKTPEDVFNLREKIADQDNVLSPMYKTLSKIREKLDTSKSLIGFCGAPWTVGLYMLDDKPSKDSSRARTWAYKHPKAFLELMDVLAESSAAYLIKQIESGADVVQIFDSWAGSVPPDLFEAAVKQPLFKMCRIIKEKHPNTPIILFPRCVNMNKLEEMANEAKGLFDALGLDFTVDLEEAHKRLQGKVAIQGNLDPALLLTTPKKVENEAQKMLDIAAKMPGYIANLGHGITPQTPIENVEALVQTVQKY